MTSDRRYMSRAIWGPAHRRWLSEVVWPISAPPCAFHADGRAVTAATERLHRRAPARHEHVKAWRLSPGVEVRQALRGVPLTRAIPRIAARGVLTRVANPRPRMNDLGLTLSASARASADAMAASRRLGILLPAGPSSPGPESFAIRPT